MTPAESLASEINQLAAYAAAVLKFKTPEKEVARAEWFSRCEKFAAMLSETRQAIGLLMQMFAIEEAFDSVEGKG